MPQNIMPMGNLWPTALQSGGATVQNTSNHQLWRHGANNTLASGVAAPASPPAWSAQGGLLSRATATLALPPAEWTTTGPAAILGAETTLAGEPARHAQGDNWDDFFLITDDFPVAAGEIVVVEFLLQWQLDAGLSVEPGLALRFERVADDARVLVTYGNDTEDPGDMDGSGAVGSGQAGTAWETGGASRATLLDFVSGDGTDRVHHVLAAMTAAETFDARIRFMSPTGDGSNQAVLVSHPKIWITDTLPSAVSPRPLVESGGSLAWTGSRPVPGGVGLLLARPTASGTMTLVEFGDETNLVRLDYEAAGLVLRSGVEATTAMAVTGWPTDEAVPIVLTTDGATASVTIDGADGGETLTLPAAITSLTRARVGERVEGGQRFDAEIIRAALTTDAYWEPEREFVEVADEATAAAQVGSRYILLAAAS